MKKAARILLISAIWLAVWEIASIIAGKDVLLPGVEDIFLALVKLCADSATWLSAGASLLRVAGGLAVGMLTGCVLGTACAFSSFLRDFFTPVMTVIKAAPVASFIILAFVWIPVGYVPVFTAFLIVTPIFQTNIFTALKGTDGEMLEMAKIFSMPFTKKLREIYIPGAYNAFTGALISSAGMSWKAGVAAEVICRNKNSIGGSLYSAKISLDTPQVFAWTALVVILSLIFEKCAVWLAGKAVRKENGDGQGKRG